MNKNKRLFIGNLLLCIAMTTLLVGAILPFFSHDWQGWKYVLAAGALGTLVAQLLIPAPSDELRIKRFAHMNVWSAIIYCIAAYCPFSHDISMQQSWVAFLLAGALMQIIAVYMIGRLSAKKDKESKYKESQS